MSTASGAVTTLVDPPQFLGDWGLSPDGKWVAYEDDDVLSVIAVTGGTLTQVTPTAGTYPYLGSWEFLPDSSAIIFSYYPDFGDHSRIYAYPLPLGSGSRLELTDSSGDYVSGYAVAPDCSRVAYVQDGWVCSIKPDGTGRTILSSTYYSAGNLVISADSTLVCWKDTFGNDFHKSSLVSSTDTSLITGGTVVPATSCQLGITPDGSQLIFIGDDGTRTDLYSLAIGGGTPVRINNPAPSPEPAFDTSNTSYLIAPNSQRILYLCDNDNSASIELMSGKIDGSGAVRLNRESLSAYDWTSSFDFYGFEHIARFLPDSSYVIYSLDEAVSGNTEIFAIHPNGSGRTQLNATLSTGSDASFGALAEDGSFLVYSGDHNNDSGTEPWVVTIPGFASSQLVDLTNMLKDVKNVCVPGDGDTLLYSAYQDSPLNAELYAVPYTSGTPVRVNNALSAGRHLTTDLEAAPGAAHAVYDMYDYGYGYRSYFGAADGSGSTLMVQKGSTNRRFTADGSAVFFLAESTTVTGQHLLYRQYFAGGPAVQLSPALFDIESFELSADDTTLVMLVALSSGEFELYSMPAAGGFPVKLNPALTTGGSVLYYAISPDSAKVVFTADAVTDGTYMLFATPLGGGSATVLEASSGSQDVSRFAISPDRSTVVFSGDLETAGVYELFAVPIVGGTRVKLNAALVADGDVDTYDDFVITSDSARVIYLADGDTDGVTEIYSAKLDGSSAVKLNGPLVAGGEVNSFEVSADGAWVAYYADQTTDGYYELYHVATAGGTATRLHPALSAPRYVRYDYQIIGSDHVIFRADSGGSSGQVRLFCTKVPDFITNRLDNNTLSTGDVASFAAAPNGAYVAYLADQTTDGSDDLYVVYGVPDVTPVPDRISLMNMPLGPLAFTVSDLETPTVNLSVTAVSSNHALLLDSGITLGGTGSGRTLMLAPVVGQWGMTTVTVTVSDGVHEAQMSFDVRFIPDPNDLPTGVILSPPRNRRKRAGWNAGGSAPYARSRSLGHPHLYAGGRVHHQVHHCRRPVAYQRCIRLRNHHQL